MSLPNATQIRILPGYVLGLVTGSLSGKLTIQENQEAWAYVFAEPAHGWRIGDVFDTTQVIQQQSFRLALIAHLVPVIKVAVVHNFTITGDYWVSLDLRNNFGEFSQKAQVRSQDAITGLNVTVPEFSLVDTNTKFQMETQSGSDIHVVLHYGDGHSWKSSQMGRNWQVTHRYTSVGKYYLNLTASNLVSVAVIDFCSTTVVNEVKGTTVMTRAAVFGKNTTIEFGLLSGSLVDMVLSLGDDSPHVNISGINVRDVFVAFKIHTYKAVGAYSVSLVAKNPISQHSTSAIAYVQDEVSGFKMSNISELNKKKSLTINMSITTGTNATYSVKFNGQPIIVNLQTEDGHRAAAVIPNDAFSGACEIEGRVYNLVSSLMHNSSAFIHTPIMGPSMWLSSGEIVATRTNLTVSIQVSNGTNINATFWNGTGGKTKFRIQPALTVVIQSVSYASPGEYTLRVNFTNAISSAAVQRVLTVISPVSDLALTTTTPRPFPPGTLNVMLKVEEPWPTNGTYTLHFGDGTQSGPKPFTEPVNETHR